MRRFSLTLILILLASIGLAARDKSLDELKADFEKAKPEDRVQPGIRIAQTYLHNADHLYAGGQLEEGRAAVEALTSYCEKARDSAIETGKHLKNLEIDVRKIADKLRDIKRTLSLDDQPPVDQAIKTLEDMRTALLKQMFSDDNKNSHKHDPQGSN